ncbi:oligosaccharide flippase family protein [Cytobacillus sp. S13-E01]|uniref:lipopolysaccharide biosynthesis protein n=1 Tax=Cytobacillus sp. S13-E01 TaxID=3031326 RepID=UPI0023D7D458|nr:oligosaccharide flippase family protein [Cytobacillus sp. S13-E01]MDF0727068.1 oligosaccharide flippase family protein [Cytobacillus sp. S13-E01]
MKNKLLKKFLAFSYGSVIGAAIAFITTMMITRILPPDEFGKASMFTLFVSIAMIVAVFGTDQAFVRFFYEEKENKRGVLLYNCLKVSLVILVPVLFVIIVIRKELLYFLFSEYNTTIFIALIVAVITQVFYRFGTLVIRMQQKGNLYSILEILSKSLILIGVVVFYSILGRSYNILIYSTVISFILLVVFLIYSQKRYWNLNNLIVPKSTHSKLEIFSYGYPLAFTTAVMWIFEGFDKFAIRQWGDFNELGLYAAAFKIIGLLAIMKMAFTTFWTPVAYETYQKDPNNTSFYANVSKLVSFLMMLVGVVVIMMKDIIIMLLGGGYEEASLMLPFLVFIPIMYTISETTVLGINFHKKVKWHIAIAGVACVVNIIGNWLLVPQFGGIGASISTGISYILFFALRTFISLYYYKVNYGLTKVYISTAVLLFFASYTLFPSQPIHEQIVGLMAIIIIIFIYLNDIKRFTKLRKEVVQ